ncbi:MAG: hypothetical protein IIB00_02965 [candidate division Zixibacteria bacterium]|nr:hypothetical protein [candidate division Zixibacteria bacterium]
MKDSSSRRNRSILIALSVVSLLIFTHGAIKAQICGDVDGGGSLDLGDGFYLVKYLAIDGPAPPNFSDADFDGFTGVSIFEYRFNGAYIGQAGPSPICPPFNQRLVAEPNSELLLTYSSLFPANQDSFLISLNVISPFTYFDGLIFPLKIRVDGQIPNILSIIEGPCIGAIDFCPSRIVADSGVVLLTHFSHWGAPLDSGGTEIETITISIPQSTVPRSIEISWTVLSPINAPTPDNSLYPLFLYWPHNPGFEDDVEGYLPTLTPRCCAFAGDADFSSEVNVGDATFIVKYIFQDGDAPPCLDAANADGENDVNIGDATYIVKFIFQDGEFPVCGATGI